MNLIVGAANTDFLDRCLYCNTNWLKQHYGNNGRGNWGNVKYQSKKIVESHDSCYVIVGNGFSYQWVSNRNYVIDEWQNGSHSKIC